MTHQRLSFDHLPFGALDVSALHHDLAQLGFTPTAIGTCHWEVGGQAYQARAISAVFAHSYLDFIEDRRPQWESFLRVSAVYGRGLAPTAIVFRVPSADDAHDQLSARGVPLYTPYSIVRELEGAAPARMSYRIFGIDRARMELPFMIIEDSAPAALRTTYWTAHRNSVRSIGALHLRTSDLQRTVQQLSKVFPDLAVPASSDSFSYRIDDAILTLHERPRDAFLQEVSAVLPAGRVPRLLALEFDATDLSAAEDCLRRSGLRFTAYGESLAVKPTEGFGCGIIIRQLNNARDGEHQPDQRLQPTRAADPNGKQEASPRGRRG